MIAHVSTRHPTLTILPIGDSITTGEAIPLPRTYRYELANLLIAAGYDPRWEGSVASTSPFTIEGLRGDRHEGHGGARITTLSAGWAGYLASITTVPDVALVIAGTNDFYDSETPATCKTRMAALLDAMWASFASMKVLLCSIPPWNPRATYDAGINAINATYVELETSYLAAGKRIAYCDINTTINVAVDLAVGDGIHPVASGYTKFATAIHAGLIGGLLP